jgi:hypothetical protein
MIENAKLPGMPDYDDLVHATMDHLGRLDEAELRRMLCLWVSGEDPAVVADQYGTLIGLSTERACNTPWLPRPFLVIRSSEEYRRASCGIRGTGQRGLDQLRRYG